MNRDPWKKPRLGAKAAAAVSPPRVAPAVQFRAEIEKALAGGQDAEGLTLHLTHRAADSLKRDRNLADEDIRYQDGRMRFLGVIVVTGAPESRLDAVGIEL